MPGPDDMDLLRTAAVTDHLSAIIRRVYRRSGSAV